MHQVQVDIQQRRSARASATTTWLSQIFSMIVRGFIGLSSYLECAAYSASLTACAHFFRRRGLAFRLQVRRHPAPLQHLSDRGVHRGGFVHQTEAVFEHRRHRCRSRPADSPCSARRCPAPNRAPAHTGPWSLAERRRRQHADRPGQHRALRRSGCRRTCSPSRITSKLRGFSTNLHGAVVHQHVLQRDVRDTALRHFHHHLAPQLRHFEHVRLVDAGQLLAARSAPVETPCASSRSISARV